MSTSYSSKAGAKLLRLLNTLVRLASVNSAPSLLQSLIDESSPSAASSSSKSHAYSNRKTRKTKSMCSMCTFLDGNKFSTCFRCSSRLISMLVVTRCSMSLDKAGCSSSNSKSLDYTVRKQQKMGSNGDYLIANLCIFILFATLMFLYKTSFE